MIHPKDIPGKILALWEFRLNSDFRKSLRVEESFHLVEKKHCKGYLTNLLVEHLRVDLGVYVPVLICDMGGQHHVTGGERPDMNLTSIY